MISHELATNSSFGKTKDDDCIVEAGTPFDSLKPDSSEDIEKIIMSSSISRACLIHCLYVVM